MAKWIDTTSCSRTGTVREPRIWELSEGNARVIVHRLHSIPDSWFVSCPTLGFCDRLLLAKSADKAKEEGLQEVRKEFFKFTLAFRKLLGLRLRDTEDSTLEED